MEGAIVEIKEFVKNVVTDIVEAAKDLSESLDREVKLAQSSNGSVIKFDVAIAVEQSGKIGLLVMNIGGKVEDKSSIAHKIVFDIYVDTRTREQRTVQSREIRDASEQARRELQGY